MQPRRREYVSAVSDTKADLAGEMRRIAAFVGVKGGLETFVFKGTNGRWRDVLAADELAAYDRRVTELLPPDCAAWLASGRGALAR